MPKQLKGTVRNALLLILASFTVAGCSLFVSHYDASAYQYFTSLKAYHLMFLDDFTVGDDKTWNETAVKSACNTGELKFREATAYAAGKNDQSRVHAFDYLHNVFKNECKLSLSSKKLFGKYFSQQEEQQVGQNYDWAIKGELSRVGASAK